MDATKVNKLIFYAGAKRADAGIIHDKNFIKHFVPMLRGKVVCTTDKYKFKNRADAVSEARLFREQCASELKELKIDF